MFHILPKSYKFSHSLCLNDFLQVWLIGNQIDQVLLFRYIYWDGEVSYLVRGRKMLYVTYIFGQPDYHLIFGQALVLVPTVGTYVEWHYIDHFSANKCHHFEGKGHNLWRVLVSYNASKGFPNDPCWRG